MPVKELRPATREDWLAIRRNLTGASEAASLLHCHPHLTLTHLWALKAGRIDPEQENAAMRRGKLLEAPALAMLAEERPTWTITPNPMPGGIIFVDDERQMGATPDCFITDPARPGRGLAQVKSVDSFAFKRTWLDDLGGVEAPLHVLIQTAVEMHMVGAKWGAIVALTIGSGIDLHILDMPHIDGLMDKLIAANREFWRLVEMGERPPPDYGRDGALIANLHRGLTPDKTIDLSGDNAFVDALHKYQYAKTLISAAEKDKATAEAEIRDKLGDATAATAGDFFVTAKLVNRAEYMAKATSYRQLRIKERG